ncbi:hypothetical protein [Mycobacteroides salmoniphilum]|uniref:Scaffolding protein n=1 Tax=Mycobacteroides salmoniphilum TaxID=404941 RepID=A0A4R8SC34_9MYCO|nr:hypothetical protein [Mycobacteroides salmoniphilum]TDZ92153.1 hypothetical protein CCUG60885_04267 [Mycobacteroides salmoniphilum]TEA07382.1 hypothetical protein CCUG60883_01415 [Mycobacteroides salmoniphilum]
MSDVTPNDMPGAVTEPGETAPATPKSEAPSNEVFSAEERQELEKLRAARVEERRWEKRAKENFDDAAKWRDLFEKSGADKKSEFDPRAEIDKIRADLTSERIERMRSEVARTTGVDPEDIKGDTEEDMRESVERFLKRFNTRLEEAMKSKSAPAAAPAAEVTSDKKVTGPQQITSRDELKNMSPQQRVEALKNGQLDELMGKK